MNLVPYCDLKEARCGPTNESLWWRIAEMRLVRSIGRRVVQHAVECRRQWFEFHHSGKNRAVSDFRIDNERRSLRDLHRAEVRSAGTDTLFHRGGLRRLEQFLFFQVACSRADFGGNVPIAHFFSISQGRMGERKPDAVIRNAKIFGGLSHRIWSQPLL